MTLADVTSWTDTAFCQVNIWFIMYTLLFSLHHKDFWPWRHFPSTAKPNLISCTITGIVEARLPYSSHEPWKTGPPFCNSNSCLALPSLQLGPKKNLEFLLLCRKIYLNSTCPFSLGISWSTLERADLVIIYTQWLEEWAVSREVPN